MEYSYWTLIFFCYRISYWRIQETIGLSDIGSRPQSIGLSDIGLRKNHRLPTSAKYLPKRMDTVDRTNDGQEQDQVPCAECTLQSCKIPVNIYLYLLLTFPLYEDLQILGIIFHFLHHLSGSHTTLVPEIIDPVFPKTSQNARFLLSENERFGLVFVKTGSINSGIGNDSSNA